MDGMAINRTTTKLFINRRSQVVRLPASCLFKKRKESESPCHTAWTDYFARSERPTNDFMQQREAMKFSERDEWNN